MTTQTNEPFLKLDVDPLEVPETVGRWRMGCKCYAKYSNSALSIISPGGPVGYWGGAFSWLRL